jgi:hypothetical protein
VCSARGGKAVARLAGEPSPSCAPQVHCAIHVLAPGDVNAAVGPNGRAVASGAGGELDVRTRRRPAVATCAGPLRRQRVVRLLGIRPRRRGPLTAEDGWVGPVTVDAGATHLRRVPCRFRAPGRGKWAPGEKRAGKVTRRGEGGRDDVALGAGHRLSDDGIAQVKAVGADGACGRGGLASQASRRSGVPIAPVAGRAARRGVPGSGTRISTPSEPSQRRGCAQHEHVR